MKFILPLVSLLFSFAAHAQGTLSIALQQQFSFTNCQPFSNACGTPLSGGLLYFYQAGTVATRQDSFVDTGLTMANPWPLTLDAMGRIPMFYLAAGTVHIRLTDSTGVVQFDIPSILVIGGTPGGGGGGGAGVDPTTIASTGDMKFRASTEFLTGWIKANGTTIGNALSGATQRANADAQALFIYLWNVCGNSVCTVSTGRGANGLADFNANKTIVVFDLRGRAPWGLDDMGNIAANIIQPSNIFMGSPTTPQSIGGEALHTLTIPEIPSITPSGSIGGSQTFNNILSFTPGANQATPAGSSLNYGTSLTVFGSSFTFNGNSFGGGGAHNTMAPFLLGTWYLKL